MADEGHPGSTLLATLIVDAFVQFLFSVPSIVHQTEKYYDISASLTYVLCLLFSLLVQVYPTWAIKSEYNARQITATLLSIVWALRLGIFLFARIKAAGEDKRFSELKRSVPRFAVAWFIQFVWIFVTALPVYTANGIPPGSQPAFGTAADVVGILVWAAGFGIETVADAQKDAFRKRRRAPGRASDEPAFISTGMWRWSRHPNYFGEILLWCGIFILCATPLTGAEWAVVVSPVFVACLLCFVSGVPILEKIADERYGQQPQYQRYKASTSLLIPLPPKKTV